MTDRAPLVVIALDSGEASLLQRERDRLPNIARLMDRGAVVPLLNEPGLYTGSVWPTLNTGVSLGRHGRYFIRQFDRATYRNRSVWSKDVPFPTLWERASDAGRRVAIIDPPKARLADDLNGVQVLDWGSHDPEGPIQTFPPEELKQLHAFGDWEHQGFICDTLVHAGQLDVLLERIVNRIRAKADYAVSLYDRGPWDLFYLVFNDTHCAGHAFWALHDDKHPEHDTVQRTAIGDALMTVMTEIDAGIGRLLERVGDARVIFFTSHGMGGHYGATAMLDETLQRIETSMPGAKAGDAAKPGRLARLHKLAKRSWNRIPKPLRKLLPVRGRDIEASLLAHLRKQRRCFQVPANDNAGAIRLNIRGRDADGRLAPEEAEAFADYLARELMKLKNSATGSPVTVEVLRTRPIVDGKSDDLPDLIVRWNRSEPIPGVVSESIGHVGPSLKMHRTGDHRSAAFAVFSDSGEAGTKAARPLVDIPATILAELGVPVDGMDGTPIALGDRVRVPAG